MLLQTRQQAWVSGLPGLVKKGGIPFVTLPISMPKSDVHSLSFALFGAQELVTNLQSLAKAGTKLPTLSIVVRTDAEKEVDNQYMMSGAVIGSVIPIRDMPEGQMVTTVFESISAKMTLSQNPGPPANCPPVQQTGSNLGWIFGLSDDKVKHGRPVEVLDFNPPYYDRQIAVTIGKPSNEIKSLAHSPSKIHELILVLPDPANQRYIEFKLWEAKVSLMENERRVVFESDFIECLMGEDN